MPDYDLISEDSGSPDINSPDFGPDGENKKSERKAIASASQALSIATHLLEDDRERDQAYI